MSGEKKKEIKMKEIKKKLSLLLIACMVLTSIPATVFADTEVPEAEETGVASPSETISIETISNETISIEKISMEKISLIGEAEDGMTVKLTAQPETFADSEGLSLEVNVADGSLAEQAESDLEEEMSGGNVAKRVTYDIRVMHDGEEVEPLEGKSVRVEFTMPEVPSGIDSISVYHHSEETGEIETVVDEVPVPENTEELSVKGMAESFSLYTIDFTYKEKTVKIPGDSDHNELSEILSEVGITEEIEDVEVYASEDCSGEPEADGSVRNEEDDVLFAVFEEDGIWYVDAVNSFESVHGMLVKTTDGSSYKVKVTDPAPPSSPVAYRYPVYNTASDPASGIKSWEDGGIGWQGTGVPYIEYRTVVDSETQWGPDVPVEDTEYWYVLNNDVTISKTVTVKGNVHLILVDGKTLSVTGEEAKAGICVSGAGNSLTVYGQSAGTGILIVTGGEKGGAGIGGNLTGDGNDITINGGIVTANGGDGFVPNKPNVTMGGGAGIGGGSMTWSKTESKNIGGNGCRITINGGIVTATGGDGLTKDCGGYGIRTLSGGAGIGGGGSFYSAATGQNEDGAASDIIINGGTVTATGGAGASDNPKPGAGIGSGGNGGNSSDIKAMVDVMVTAGDSADPASDIGKGHTESTDLAEGLKEKRYAVAVKAAPGNITLDAAGGTAGTKTSVTVTYGKEMPVLKAEELPSKDGKVFSGFFDTTEGGTKYYNADGTSAKAWDRNVATGTLYAQWDDPAPQPVDPTPQPVDPVPQPISFEEETLSPGWNASGKDWKYVKTDGSFARNEWVKVGDKWYHFGKDTLMDTGWLLDTDGSWYYLDKVEGTNIGVMQTGWMTDPYDGYRYYLDPVTGKMYTGWHVIDGKRYYFNEIVPAASGWTQNEKEDWVYSKRDIIPLGAMLQ